MPTWFGFFDFSVAPQLLFYAYVPAIVVALILGGFVMIKDHFSRSSRLLAAIAISFSLWTLNIFVQWVAAPVSAVMLAWQFTALFEVAIFIFAIYFVYAFLDGKDLSFVQKLPLVLATLPILILLPSRFNITGFDLAHCEGAIGPLWWYVYAFEILAIVWIALASMRRYRAALDPAKKAMTRNLALGMVLFLSLFSASNILGEIFQIYSINLVGPIGMVLFVGFLTYTIVQFRAFNVKLLATSALVWSLSIAIGSQLFFVENKINFVLVSVTFVGAVVLGSFLSKSVQREVEQRERLQALSDQLKAANTQLTDLSKFKTQLLSLASHQIKAPLAAMKGYIALMLEGAYGPIPEPMAKPVASLQHSADGLVELVMSLLDLRKIEEGKMEYQFTRNDLAAIVKDVVGELSPLAAEKKLTLTAAGLDAPIWVLADAPKLKQVAQNLVDNSIKYTPSGSVAVALKVEGHKVLCTVTDTGLGMAPELLPRLFDEFTRDQRVQRTIRGTGLGLYIAKRIIEAHGGTVWAESKGEGQGSTFTFTLPVTQ